MKKPGRGDWILRFVKGMFIGSGFILPGVSGGALAAVFGIYERMIAFLANLKKDFRPNAAFFFPVALGMAFGVFVLSFPIDALLKSSETYVLWFFIGCILGTLPALFRKAEKKGFQTRHLVLMAIVCAGAYAMLRTMQEAGTVTLSRGIFTWMLAGVLIGLGVVIPGLSPSNLLMYLNLEEGIRLYEGMTGGIKHLDFGLIIPLILGAAGCVLLFSKLMNYIFSRAYAALYHAIIGFVFASTLIIVPLDFNYISLGGLFCLIMCLAGMFLAVLMTRLEAKYKKEPSF